MISEEELKKLEEQIKLINELLTDFELKRELNIAYENLMHDHGFRPCTGFWDRTVGRCIIDGSNTPPKVDAGQDREVDTGNKVVLSGEATDFENNIVSYQWTQTAGKAVELTVTADGKIASFTPQNEGIYGFTFTAKDSEGLTGTDSVIITVKGEPQGVEKKLSPISIVASKQDSGKEADKVNDGDFESRWSGEGKGEYIEFTFDKEYRITKVALTGYHYHKTYTFQIAGQTFTNEAGRPENELVEYDLRNLNIKSNKVRIIGQGNESSDYNSYREIYFYGLDVPAANDPVAKLVAPSVVKPGDEVLLNGTGSVADELKIIQTSGPTVTLKVAGPFRQSFTAPNSETTLSFQAIASKSGKTDTTNVTIQVTSGTVENPVAKLVAPSNAKGGDEITLDGTGSIADTFTITQTAGNPVNLVDVSKFIKKFTAPNENINVAFQAVAQKGGKQSITQVAIQITKQGGNTGNIDEYGIQWIVANGEQSVVEMSRDRADDDRWSGNIKGLRQGFEATFIGKSKGSADHFAMKQFGGNHSGSGASSQRWYDTGLRSNGNVQLQWEGPHPKNHDFNLPDSKWFIKKISKGLLNNWIGLKWCVQTIKPNGSPADGGIRCRMWVDEDPINESTGKPNNNWKLVYDFIDGVDVKVIEPQSYKAPDEQDMEIRRSGTQNHDIYGLGKIITNAKEGAPGLHVRALGNPSNPPPPDDNPTAKLVAPSKVQGGQTVVLDGSQSVADTLEIKQISGQTVNLTNAGTFKKQFTAPNGNLSLGFEAKAIKGTKQAITQITIQISTDLPPPPPPEGEVLWDSNVHLKTGKSYKITGKHGDQSPDGKGVFMAASGSPRLLVEEDGTFHLEADKGHGRVYIQALNYNARLEGEVNMSDDFKVVRNTTWRLRTRHNEGGDCSNRFGGFGATHEMEEQLAEYSTESCHNNHENTIKKPLAKKVQRGQWIKFRFSVCDTTDKKKVLFKTEYDYNDGQGWVEVLKGEHSSPKDYYMDEKKFMERSMAWLRMNNEATGKVTYRNVKIIKLNAGDLG